MINRIIIILFMAFNIHLLNAQESNIYQFFNTPGVAIKNNLLSDATTTLNLSSEFKISSRSTIDLAVGYNPWTFSENKKFKHILVRPEYRFWLCEPFNGHFLGVSAYYSYYNVGHIKLPLKLIPSLEESRYQGWLVGSSFTYGYQWYLSPRWSMEAVVSVGYAYLDYDQYESKICGAFITSSDKHYIGLTRLGLSIIYIIR